MSYWSVLGSYRQSWALTVSTQIQSLGVYEHNFTTLQHVKLKHTNVGEAVCIFRQT